MIIAPSYRHQNNCGLDWTTFHYQIPPSQLPDLAGALGAHEQSVLLRA